jgi:polyferredoxin
MAGNGPGWWWSSVVMASAILHDRGMRRRVLSSFLVLLLMVFAGGLWVFDRWLSASPLRFVIWLGGCGLLALFVFAFALVDAMAVIREERERFRKQIDEGFPDSSCDDDE